VRPLALVVLAFLACGGSAQPDEVALDFWRSVERGRPAHPCEPPGGGAELRDPSVGETLDNERSALVTTALTRRTAEGELRLTFYTHLVRTGEGWEVDCDATRADLQKAVFAGSMREFGDALGRGARELGEAIDAGVRELDRSLREALEGSGREGR
jgi:hypothetical protein